MQIGMVGLGRMGGNMATRLVDAGHDVIGYARSESSRGEAGKRGLRTVSSLEELADALERPRTVWSMVPAGAPTEEVVGRLAELLDSGETIVDGGNSNFRESIRRAESLAAQGITLVDTGVSGGIWGLREGYCLMIGGDAEAVERLAPIFDALAPESGWAHLGPSGSGHFVKMVHNGIEYGLLQAYGEGFEILMESELDIDLHQVAELWRRGSVVRSWLLDLLARALEEDPTLERIKGYVEDSGEGRWAVLEAIEENVPAPVTALSLFARFASRQDESFAAKVIAALRNEFGGHAVKSSDE
ncbi:MAG: phosphogluconate dehydrogenase (NAD(+)-dependent, decarboxylating) [Actinomycetota bacterium]